MHRLQLLIVSGLFFFVLTPAKGFEPDSIFAEANGHYRNADYDQALGNYLSLAEKGYVSASLFYNIGNCYFKNGELGYAILYYLRAGRLDPNNDDIQTNLAFARQFMPTRLEGIRINPITVFFDMVVEPFTLNNIAWISSILFVAFMLFLSAVIYFRFSSLAIKITGYVFLTLLLVSLGMTTYKFRTEYLTEKGVIVSDEARVYSTPTVDSDLEFIGGFGLTFEVDKSGEDYYLVIFENKRKGWIKKEDVEVI